MGTKEVIYQSTVKIYFRSLRNGCIRIMTFLLRELVSNGCDAITKLKKLDMMGEYNLSETTSRKFM